MKNYCYNCMNEISAGMICNECIQMPLPVTAPHHLKPGTLLNNGKYLVGNVIGEGGFGITYIGRNLLLDTKVAIKEFYPVGYANRNNQVSNELTITTDEQRNIVKKGAQSFLDEARKVANYASERGIVDVLDYMEENETAYIVMEYLDGITLSKYIQDNGPMDPKKTVTLLLPIMKSLKKMHINGLIHRDISPENIMLLKEGSLKLMDFGSARVYFESNRNLTSVVKPGYAPEEQYRENGEQGPWTDVYGMCATIYKCVTGVTPEGALERLIDDKLQDPREFNKNISESFASALEYGLRVRAKERCQNMSDLIMRFEENQSPQSSETDDNLTVYADENMTVYADGMTGDRGNPAGYVNNGMGYPGNPTGYVNNGMGYPNNGINNKNVKKSPVVVICAIMIGTAVLGAALFGGIKLFKEIEPFEKIKLFGNNGNAEKSLGEYYVTGCIDVVKIREKPDEESTVLTKLVNGEKVALVEKGEDEYWKVSIEAEEITGYMPNYYLTNEKDAVIDPVKRYVKLEKGENLIIRSLPETDAAAIGILEIGQEVTLMADMSGKFDYIYVADQKIYGYAESSKLSENPVELKKTSDDENSSDEIVQKEICGPGAAPTSNQGQFYVYVQKGYLALRNAKVFDSSNEIGKMYNGDCILAIKTNEKYWYVYSPSLGMYGYVNSEYLTTTPMGTGQNRSSGMKYYANVNTGYLALRSAPAYDSSNEIGKIANGQEVNVIDTSEDPYWYVYVPGLGQSGYVNSEYLR